MKRNRPIIIGDIIKDIIKRRNLSKGLELGAIYSIYNKVVGELIASKTLSKSLKDNILYCYLDSSVAKRHLIENRLQIVNQINFQIKKELPTSKIQIKNIFVK